MKSVSMPLKFYISNDLRNSLSCILKQQTWGEERIIGNLRECFNLILLILLNFTSTLSNYISY